MAKLVWHLELKMYKKERLTNDCNVHSRMSSQPYCFSWIQGNRPRGRVLIAPDSASALMSIQSTMSQSRQDTVIEVAQLVNGIIHSGIDISFLWLPAHFGIRENELADKYAKKKHL